MLNKMKKILIYITPEKHASLFDIIVAYNADTDVVIPYNNISIDDIREIVHNSVFTRPPEELKNTAIFIGGHDVNKAEEMLNEIIKAFNELPPTLRVSIAIDPDGAYTTSSACVVKIRNKFKSLSGKNATVLAGTGPVGQRVSVLLAIEGCNVKLTSRKLDRAKDSCNIIKKKYDQKIIPVEASDDETIKEAIRDSDIVVTAGPEGVEILPERIWSGVDRINVMADVNAVPPYGIGGLKVIHKDVEIKGKIIIGAISIGNLKMKTHLRLVKDLFNRNNQIFDLLKIYDLTNRINNV
ncbi:MAG: methylenetetrahydrofolate dehydrogenase [Candidatus Altiarchaeales archaeon]|nr:MAG: methylenetetrahydrofolate dehydrogenase [Candidatus Altiarchaeales archaeon]